MNLRILAIGTLLAAPLFAGLPAQAQTATAPIVGGDSETITAQLKVISVDQKTRHVTLQKPNGENVTIVAGDNIRNLAQVHAGQTVLVSYFAAVAYELTSPNAKTPPNGAVVVTDHAAAGALPGAAAAVRTVVTGIVVGVDLAHNQLQLVNPKGGKIVTIDVKDPERRKQLAKVKVGDNLTVVFTEALAMSVEPVKSTKM